MASFEHFNKALEWLDEHREHVLTVAETFSKEHPQANRKLHTADYIRSALHARINALHENQAIPKNLPEFLENVWKAELERLRKRQTHKLRTHDAAYKHIKECLEKKQTAEEIMASHNNMFRPLPLIWLKDRKTDSRHYTGFGSLPAYLRVVFGVSVPDYPLTDIHQDMYSPDIPRVQLSEKKERAPRRQKPTPPPRPLLSVEEFKKLYSRPAPTVETRPSRPPAEPIRQFNVATALTGLPKREYKGIPGAINLVGDVLQLAVTQKEPRLLEMGFWQSHPRLAPVHTDIRGHKVEGKRYAGHGSWRNFLKFELKCPEWLLPKTEQ